MTCTVTVSLCLKSLELNNSVTSTRQNKLQPNKPGNLVRTTECAFSRAALQGNEQSSIGPIENDLQCRTWTKTNSSSVTWIVFWSDKHATTAEYHSGQVMPHVHHHWTVEHAALWTCQGWTRLWRTTDDVSKEGNRASLPERMILLCEMEGNYFDFFTSIISHLWHHDMAKRTWSANISPAIWTLLVYRYRKGIGPWRSTALDVILIRRCSHMFSD